jgi:hypothetical protein
VIRRICPPPEHLPREPTPAPPTLPMSSTRLGPPDDPRASRSSTAASSTT